MKRLSDNQNKKSDKTILIIGGTGLLGHSFAEQLSKKYKVISFSNIDIDKKSAIRNVEYVVGDVWDTSSMSSIFEKADVVVDCISMTMPNSNTKFLDDEIKRTITYMNYVLTLVVKAGIKCYVFPSSGGAIYGNEFNVPVDEKNATNPCTPYGLGKKICEDILMYYSLVFGIDVYSLRIGNVYGSPLERDKAQGVIDLLVQKSLKKESFEIWGNALSCVRDYIFLSDVAEAVEKVLYKHFNEKTFSFKTYNIGTGKGTTLAEVMQIIENNMGYKLSTTTLNNGPCGVNSIVLSCEKAKSDLGWQASTFLEEGIKKTIKSKELLLESERVK